MKAVAAEAGGQPQAVQAGDGSHDRIPVGCDVVHALDEVAQRRMHEDGKQALDGVAHVSAPGLTVTHRVAGRLQVAGQDATVGKLLGMGGEQVAASGEAGPEPRP